MPAPDTIPLTGWPFDLKATLQSGQVFHWHAHDGGWAGLIGDEPVWISQPSPEALQCTEGRAGIASQYLGLDHAQANTLEIGGWMSGSMARVSRDSLQNQLGPALVLELAKVV